MKRTSTPSLPVARHGEGLRQMLMGIPRGRGLAAIGFGQGFIDYVLCSRTRTRHTAQAPHIPTRLWSRAGMPPLPSCSSSSQIPLCASSTKIGTLPTVFRPETRPIAMKSPYSPALFAEDSTLILRTADIQDALRTLHPNLVRCNKQGVTRPQARGPSPRAPTPPSRAPRQQARAQPTRDPNTRSFATRHHHPRPRRPIGNEFDLDW
jgi:hypothetical protein